MSSPGSSSNVPTEYWSSCLEPALLQSLKEFLKHEESIAKNVYIDDFMSCLVSFGIRAAGSANLISKTLSLVTDNKHVLSPRAIENWMFFMSRVDQKQTQK